MEKVFLNKGSACAADELSVFRIDMFPGSRFMVTTQ